MSGRSDFTDDEWAALTEAPLLVMVTMFAAGEHGPISMVKESSAGARVITQPGNRGSASGLINEIIPVAQSKETRHDVGHPKGASMEEIVTGCLDKLSPAASALARLPGDEGAQVGAWLVDVAAAVAGAAKGVQDGERDAVTRIATLFGVPAPTL
jgi:hypothetical protein